MVVNNDYSGEKDSNWFNRFIWNAGNINGYYSECMENEKWTPNITYLVGQPMAMDNDISLTLTLDCTKTIDIDSSSEMIKDDDSFYKATFYLNGKELFSSGYNTKNWEDFANKKIDLLSNIFIGLTGVSTGDTYLGGNIYSLRFYTRALNDSEVFSNYEKTVAYRNAILNN